MRARSHSDVVGHPGYLDDPRAFLHDEEVRAFIEQYGLESPWVAADN